MTDEQKKWALQGMKDAYLLLMTAYASDEEKEKLLKLIELFKEKET